MVEKQFFENANDFEKFQKEIDKNTWGAVPAFWRRAGNLFFDKR